MEEYGSENTARGRTHYRGRKIPIYSETAVSKQSTYGKMVRAVFALSPPAQMAHAGSAGLALYKSGKRARHSYEEGISYRAKDVAGFRLENLKHSTWICDAAAERQNQRRNTS